MVDDRAKRDLLYGLQALRSKLVAPEALFSALQRWALRPERSLSEVLLEGKVISPPESATLEHNVQSLLRRNDQDLDRSLGEVTLAPVVVERLASIDHAVIREFLGRHASRTSQASVGAPAPGGAAAGPAPARSDRFEALRPHAKGGRGEVHVALDRELQREVAFKQIQERYLDDPDSRQRFQFEAEVTGQLEHPGIVPVYSAGLDPQGHPYYAMRLIRGESLEQAIQRYHADERHDPRRAVLGLRHLLNHLLVACHAVAYAHSRGVVHRDLKPDNIMVGKFGETFVVDWGLAKRLEDASDSSVVTRAPSGSPGDLATTQPGSVAGTPAYMSPEQAAGQLGRLGPASDIYSLGATLYRLLTGRNAFERGEVSDVLGAVQRGEFDPPRKLDPTLSPPLEAICLKAMAREPAQRYATPEALAGDLERWMAGEPVEAWPEPWSIRARRWVGRHRTLVVTSVAAVVVATLGLGAVAAVQARANRETTRVNVELASANAELGRTQERLQQANSDLTDTNLQLSEANEGLAVARDRAASRADLAIRAVEQIQAAVEENLDVQNRPELADLRRRLLESPREFYQAFRDQLLASEDADPETRERLARVYSTLGRISWQVGSQAAGLESMDEALAVAQDLVERAPEDLAALRLLAGIRNERGSAYSGGLDPARARGEFVEARRLLEQVTSRAPDDLDSLALLGLVLHNLGMTESAQGDPEAALELLERGRGTLERALASAPDRRDVRNYLLRTHEVIGTAHIGAGRPQAALEAFDRALPIAESLVDEEPTSIQFRLSLAYVQLRTGIAHINAGRSDAAREHTQAALGILQELAAESPSHVEVLVNLAQALQTLSIIEGDTGQLSGSITHLQESLAVLGSLIAREPGNLTYRTRQASCLLSLGSRSYSAGRIDEAIGTFQDLVPVLEDLLREDPGDMEHRQSLAGTLYNIGTLLGEKGRLDEALPWYERSLELRRALVQGHPEIPRLRSDLAYTLGNLSGLYEVRQEDERARALQLEACDIQLELVAGHPELPQYRADLARSQSHLSAIEQSLGRPDEAERNLLEARAILEPVVAASPALTQYQRDLAGVQRSLGRLYTDLGRLGEAEGAFGTALEILDRLCREFPQEYLHRERRGRVLADYARSLVRGARLEAGIEIADAAVAELEPLLADNPQDVRVCGSLRTAHRARAEAVARSGDPAAALEEWTQALALGGGDDSTRDVDALGPAWVALWSGDVAGAARHAEQFATDGELGPEELFELARLLALAAGAEADEAASEDLAALAVDQLRAAAAQQPLSSRLRVLLEHDADFEALRGRAELESLVRTGR